MAEGHRAKRVSDPDAAVLRRVGWRLAALTVGLLCALLLALGSVVYLTTQHLLLQSLEDTLQRRAATVVARAPALARVPLPPLGRRRFAGLGQERGGVFLVIANRSLTLVAGAGPGGAALPDPGAARKALQGQLSSPFSTQQIDDTGPYLIYTAPIAWEDGTALDVVQTSASERQYLNSLNALLRVLVIVSALGLLASAAISGVVAGRALRPIQAALRRQRDFVADAAHELRTPLAIMRTAAELGLANGADEQAALEQMLAQNAHLTRLVDGLSLLARADSGAIAIERSPVDLGRLVAETVGGVEILAEDRAVQLQVNTQGEVRVTGDAGRLRQLLLILLDNALKYTPEGGAISVSVQRQGRQARLQVRDSGPGIDPHDLPHIFDRFYRADRARAGEGTGLGLAIGRWVAEAHGGSITAANAPGHGALFTVTLPAS